MLLWSIAVAAGLLAAALSYGVPPRARTLPLALLRALAATLVVALLAGAPAGAPTRVAPDVALDASESWTRGGARCRGWPAALDTLRRLGGTARLFGDSLRDAPPASLPADRSSSLRTVADRAVATGRPVVVVTDGELDDAELLPTLPRGSRVIALPCAVAADLAVTGLEAPRALLAGDSATLRVTLMAGAAGSPATSLDLLLDDVRRATLAVPALAPFAEQALDVRAPIGGAERAAVLRARLRAGDAEPRNDTVAVAVDVTRAPSAVFVSTAPDFDAREAVAALRGVTSLPTRAFYRVAPGAWRADGSLARAEERAVRDAVREAPLVVLHGDTSAFGPPRAATRASLLLFAPPAADDGEWFASASPPSPLSTVIGTLPLDSLSPLAVSPALPRAQWEGLVAHRGGASEVRRTALVGWDEPRRIAVLGASGFWRWRFRGGVRADAYAAFFGTLFDWLAGGRSDRRAAVPADAVVRAGAPVRWRRGATADSAIGVTLRRRGQARTDTLRLAFPAGSAIAESPPLEPGVYDVSSRGGASLLAVNASRELLPRRPTVRSGAVGGAAPLGDPRPLRDLGWIYGLVVLTLCAEWLGRRRAGLR